MSELLGIIAPLRKFLSNSNEIIQVQVKGEFNEVLSLQENREYIIPDFQREIRWDKDNLSQLIDDIKSGPKYLGNIILTQNMNENKFLIIDGQQRITVLTMILTCLCTLHYGQIDTITPCKLRIESFLGFEKIVEYRFPDIKKLESEIIDTDKLHQIGKYYELWHCIKNTDNIFNRRDAKLFINNLGKSNINIILNRSDDLKDGIRYFIDVNLKGKQLDTEDIFKAYLFRNDSGNEIRSEWYNLATNVSRINCTKMKYPLLKLLEHYFFCDLYNEPKFKGMVFDEEFLLKSEFKTREDMPIKYRARTHLIEVIDDNIYMLKSLKMLNKVIVIMLNIVANFTNSDFHSMFSCVSENGKSIKMDTDELKVIHNFIGKILKDDKILPKALVMKYILTVLIDGQAKSKSEYKKIYGVYLLSVLFIIFENNKSKDVFMSVLKASNEEWYTETVKQINSYFVIDKITDNKIISQFKQGTNEDAEDYRFRCKSLATVYNFFRIKEDRIILSGNLDKVKKFVTDDDKFSTEHFIISESKTGTMRITCGKNENNYIHNKDIFRKYINSLFNFIFISETINTEIGNYWIPQKMQLINLNNLECDYSKMVINNLVRIKDSMQKDVNENNYKDRLDLFFARDFKELYIEYARNVLNAVIDKIKEES